MTTLQNAILAALLPLTVVANPSVGRTADASCIATQGTHSLVKHFGSRRSQCQAQADSGGRAKSHAAEAGLAGSLAREGGIAEADATDGAQATSEAAGGRTNASAVGQKAKAVASVRNEGSAKATAGRGGQAVAVATVKCTAEANASGLGSFGHASCSKVGSLITVEATKGSFAEGSDTKTPLCKRVNGGVAKVRSPAGNCG
jgi:hypothetical protein